MIGAIKLFSGNASPELARDIARHLGVPLGDATVSRFSDGEIQVEIADNVRGRDVYLIQPTCSPSNESIMELLIMVDACKRASAERITAVIPYYGYARQDRKAAPRAPITAKLIADLLEAAGVSRVLTMDLHAGQIQGFFNVPVDNLYGSKNLIPYLEKLVGGEPNLVVVSPDAGGTERARAYAKVLGCGLAVIDKRRSRPNESAVMHIIGDVDGKVALLVDDMIDTAGTLTGGAKALVEKGGATRVIAVATHGVLSGPAIQRLKDSPIEMIITTDTIPLSEGAKNMGKMENVSVADLFAKAIRSIHEADSVSRLFL
jgi:ribose-phosphate pyrophosphokinase